MPTRPAGQPGGVRLRWFLGMMALVVAVAGATALAATLLDGSTGGGDQVVSGADGTVSPGTAPSSTTVVSTVPPEGQLTVTGTVTVVHVDGAVLDPREVPTPLTVTSDRGFGNGGELTGVTVDGAAASVVWDGGRPFVLSSGGALVLDPVVVDLTPAGLRVALAGSVQGLTPGTYVLDTPVAVGTSGVAGARDQVTFSATEDSRFQAAGDAALFLDGSGPRHLTGPGSVHLEGALEVTDATGTRVVSVVDLAEGPFDVVLTPTGDGGWTITATLQGETTAA